MKDRRSIDDRPDIVATRQRVGDWEADTIIGKNHKQAIVGLVDRTTSEAVGQAMTALLKPFENKVLTIPSDNGKDFAGHKQVALAVNADFYFAHPYSS